MYATESGHLEVVKLLLTFPDVNVNVQNDVSAYNPDSFYLE